MSLLTDPPDMIWLQFYGDSSPEDGFPGETINTADVSWCTEKIFEHDVPYARLPWMRRTIDNIRLVASTWGDHPRKQETLRAFALEIERMIENERDGKG